MATVTASHLVSVSSRHGASGSETKTNLTQIAHKNQAMTHSGLRSLNNLDMLRVKSPKAVARQAVRKVKDPKTDRNVGPIVCGHGMSIVLVSAEVGPWSKTGGLGDVLGGLPPALAVSWTVLLI